MIFELIDSKKICDSCFIDGKIIPFSKAEDLSHTWDFSSIFEDEKYELACLYTKTKNIEDACSNTLREKYLLVKLKLKAYLKSCMIAKVSLKENCFFDLVPVSFLEELFFLRREIIKEIFESCKRPENYDFLYDLNKLIYKISENNVKLNIENLDASEIEMRDRASSHIGKVVKYNIFGAVTGRLTTEPESFPILTIAKSLRSIVEPTNDFLLELDFNAFEPRIFLGLNGKEQPTVDLHNWNKENIFINNDHITRNEAKIKFLGWLYDEKGRNFLTDEQIKMASKLYNRENIKKTYYNGNIVKNFYGREILTDAEHCLSYTVQSTASDCFLRQAIKVDKLLKNKNSFIKFLIHDSIVIDMSLKDKTLIKNICETFSETDFGKFVITKKVGKNFGNMNDY